VQNNLSAVQENMSKFFAKLFQKMGVAYSWLVVAWVTGSNGMGNSVDSPLY